MLPVLRQLRLFCLFAVAVPREAAAGAYTVRAFGTNRVIVATPLTIVGATAEEEGGQREQEEPLLAPMPHAQPLTIQLPMHRCLSSNPRILQNC